MRIETTSVGDFLANLAGVGVYRKTIYCERSFRPLNGKSKRDATSFDVHYQLSAVLEFADGGQALLTCGVDCGTDRRSADGGQEGSKFMAECDAAVFSYCEENGLFLLPGKLDQ